MSKTKKQSKSNITARAEKTTPTVKNMNGKVHKVRKSVKNSESVIIEPKPLGVLTRSRKQKLPKNPATDEIKENNAINFGIATQKGGMPEAKANLINESHLTVATKRLQQIQYNSLKPASIKRFVVKLRKIPEPTAAANLMESTALNTTREFVIKLKKIDKSSLKSSSIMKTNELQSQSKSISLKNNKVCGIKKIAGLSLKKPSLASLKNKTILERTQPEPLDKSVICFEPARNSTLLVATKNNLQQMNEDNEKSTPSKRRSRNLANKSDAIENVLNSLNDDEEVLLNSTRNKIENICNSNKNTSSTHNKTKKFFHREKDLQTNIKQQPARMVKRFETQKIAARRCLNKKSGTNLKRESIYEFLSPSQNSDSDHVKHVDPTADIIKKLIDQGKVQVATSCKGTGKPKLKRQKPQRKIVVTENKARKKLKPLRNGAKKVKFTEENKNGGVEEAQDYEDHFDNDDDHYDDLDHDKEIQRRNNLPNNHADLANEQEGKFSNLARSAIMNQAGCLDWERKRQPILLTKHMKCISTPINKKMLPPPTPLDMELSPIAMAHSRTTNMSSPWRVNNDAYLPTTFNFSRSSGNLPSFSCDFIPLTPKKQGRKINPNLSHESPARNIYNDDVQHMQIETQKLSEPSVISSFSSNDSNAENLPPSGRTPATDKQIESIYHSDQLPNLRKKLNHRSPLKTLNIIEVINLPPYKHATKTTTQNKLNETLDFVENLNDSCREEESAAADMSEQRRNSLKNTEICAEPKDDLFGFEDYLSQTDHSSQDNNATKNDTRTDCANQTIYDKLQGLRKFKPDEGEHEKIIESISPIKTMNLFIDVVDATKVDGMRQTRIKEMLCSTMLHPQPSTSKEALRELNRANLKSRCRPRLESDLNQTELFQDLEPETTFNENDAHRTYIRPYKRKRRLKEDKYMVYLDSDESEDEGNSHEQENSEHSREANSSSEKAQKKKRHRKEHKEIPEMLEFVKEFNEMCKEVDSYNLVVEKST